jgi:hypothetical protein
MVTSHSTLRQNHNIIKDPIRKAHFVGSSVVLTLDPIHVKRLGIDDSTFFVQKPVEDGILLQRCELQFGTKNETRSQSADIAIKGKSKWSRINKTGMAFQRHPNSVLTYRTAKDDELL